MTGRRSRGWSVVLLAAAAVLVAACGSSSSASSASGMTVSQVAGSSQTDSHYPGAQLSPQVVGKPSVELTDTSGQPYDVATATAGQVTLLYFGYTNCPDVCPINMALTAAAIRDLPAADQSRVVTVFITTDPNRDTEPVIRNWLNQFSDRFVGLRGTPSQIGQAEQTAGMPASAVADMTANGNYQVVHAGYLLAYSTDGQGHLEFYDNATPAQFATSLKHLLAGGFQP